MVPKGSLLCLQEPKTELNVCGCNMLSLVLECVGRKMCALHLARYGMTVIVCLQCRIDDQKTNESATACPPTCPLHNVPLLQQDKPHAEQGEICTVVCGIS
jgi:hypothetical protein